MRRMRGLLSAVCLAMVACAEQHEETPPPHDCRGVGIVVAYESADARDRAAGAIEAAVPELRCAQRYAWSGLFCLPVADPECGFVDGAEAAPYLPRVEQALANAGLGAPEVSEPALDPCLCRDYAPLSR